jgi:hypothetical protein
VSSVSDQTISIGVRNVMSYTAEKVTPTVSWSANADPTFTD